MSPQPDLFSGAQRGVGACGGCVHRNAAEGAPSGWCNVRANLRLAGDPGCGSWFDFTQLRLRQSAMRPAGLPQ